MKTLPSLFVMLLAFQFVFAQKESRDEFLFAVIEFHKTNTDQNEIKIVAAEVIPKKLKRPSKSENHLKNSDDYITVHITNDRGTILDEIIVKDPFIGHFEYSDEDENLARIEVPLKTNTLGLRRHLSPEANHLKIYQTSKLKSNASKTFKFR